MRAAVPAAKSIGRLVNTHANGDHTFGNQLVAGAEIIASRACAEEMKERPAEELAAISLQGERIAEFEGLPKHAASMRIRREACLAASSPR